MGFDLLIAGNKRNKSIVKRLFEWKGLFCFRKKKANLHSTMYLKVMPLATPNWMQLRPHRSQNLQTEALTVQLVDQNQSTVQRDQRQYEIPSQSSLLPPSSSAVSSSNPQTDAKVIFASGGITNESQVREVLAASLSAALTHRPYVRWCRKNLEHSQKADHLSNHLRTGPRIHGLCLVFSSRSQRRSVNTMTATSSHPSLLNMYIDALKLGGMDREWWTDGAEKKLKAPRLCGGNIQKKATNSTKLWDGALLSHSQEGDAGRLAKSFAY